MPSDFDALVAEARENYSARTWLHDCSSLERDLLASLAASKHGTQALDFRKDPLLVRRVFTELQRLEPPVVALGKGACDCGEELDAEGRCPWRCFEDQPRAERPFAKRWG